MNAEKFRKDYKASMDKFVFSDSTNQETKEGLLEKIGEILPISRCQDDKGESMS